MQELLYLILLLMLIIFFVVLKIKISKQKKNILEHIYKNSEKLQHLRVLNIKYKFHDLHPVSHVYKFYDNKSNFKRISPSILFRYDILNNLNEYSKVIEKIKFNKSIASKYNEEYNEIDNKNYNNQSQLLKISSKRYKSIEDDFIKELTLRPVTNVNVVVTMEYSSPKGQVNLTKKDVFNFNDIFTAFNSVSRNKLDKKTYDDIVLAERGEVSDSMRYDVFYRDHFKCKICGASSDQGVQLHVDHVIPVSKGGKSTIDNLQTLCERCNIGKSNKLDPEDHSSKCNICGSELVLRKGRNGEFLGCSQFPNCTFTKSVN